MTGFSVEARAIAQLRLRLEQTNPGVSFDANRPDYLAHAADNLIAGLALERVRAELEAADGGELHDEPNRPAKFRAVRSSSALAVNTFAPWREHADLIPLAGELVVPTKLKLEAKLRPLARGRSANLDALGTTTAGTVVAVESKLLEPLSSKAASFQDAYKAIAKNLGDRRGASPWYAHVGATHPRRHLDVGQLIRHYLALARWYSNVPVVLVYAYWEPADAAELEVFRVHRSEITAFAASVADDPHVRFAPICYRDLWETWEQADPAPWLADHVANLRARYDVQLLAA